MPRGLGSLYVASYDSQGYGGGILTLPQPEGGREREREREREKKVGG
jgi:hypothetical protein